jgi:hypothetical protein
MTVVTVGAGRCSRRHSSQRTMAWTAAAGPVALAACGGTRCPAGATAEE